MNLSSGHGADVATVVACPDGPLLLRGDVRVQTEDGTEIPRNRRTVALCRCGRSGIAPWCDGTHKVVRFSARGAETAGPSDEPGDGARSESEEDPCAHRRPAGR